MTDRAASAVLVVLSTFALPAALPACGSSSGDAATSAAASALTPVAYPGSLAYVVCDVKRPLAQLDTPLDPGAYKAVIHAFQSALGCNAIRLYIDPAIPDPSQYPAFYTAVLHEARRRGLRVYANPLGTGSFGLSDDDYVAWIVAYANTFQPHFLGPFNESGLAPGDLEYIAAGVRAGLNYAPVLEGPDDQHIETSLHSLATNPELAASFDVFGSHNANDDQGATSGAWTRLSQTTGIATWASENPRSWSVTSAKNKEIGVAAVVAAPIAGLVLYEAFPNLVDGSGNLTAEGAELVGAGL